MKAIKYLCIAMFTLSITACDNSSSDNDSDEINSEYQGIWQAAGYGSVFQIENNRVDSYKYTSSYCLLEDSNTGVNTADIEDSLRLINDHTQFELFNGYGTANFSAPGMIFTKVAELPTTCQTNLLKQVGEPGYEQNYELDLAIFHEIFKDYYFDFETKQVDIDNLYQIATQAIMHDTTEEELLDIMAEMVAPLADTHIQIINSDNVDFYHTTNKQTMLQKLIEEFADLNQLPFPIPAEQLTPTLINDLNAYITQMYELQWELIADYAPSEESIKTAENGLIRWFENENIGYLYIGAMTGYAEESDGISDIEYAQNALTHLNAALNLALTDLAHTQGLIIDIRTNNGGHDYISLAIASRFVSSSNTHVYSKQAREGDHRSALIDVFVEPSTETQYLSPIVLLTSSNTISAAETFTLAMKQLANVTLIGESTQGSLSDILSFPLPNGFEIGLSNEFYLSPTGEWFEHSGIPVDIEVPFFTIEQREQEFDAGIETAFELLTH